MFTKSKDELLEAMGRAAYRAYCTERGWKAFDGSPLPQWIAVKPEIKEAWVAAGKAALTEFLIETDWVRQ